MPKDNLPSNFNSFAAGINLILEADAIMADIGNSESTTITTKFPFISLNNNLRQNVFSFFSLAERALLAPVSTTTQKDIEILSEKFFDYDKNELIKLLCSRLAQDLPLNLNSEGFLKRLYELSLSTETKIFEKIAILLYLIKYQQQYPAAFTVAQFEAERLLQELVFYCDDDNYRYVSLKLAELLADKASYKIRLSNVITKVMRNLIGVFELDVDGQPITVFFPMLEEFLSMYSFNTSSTIIHQFIRAYLKDISINKYNLDRKYDENERSCKLEYGDTNQDEPYIRKCARYLNIKYFEFLWSQWTGVNYSTAYYIFDSALENMREPSQRALYLERIYQRFININNSIEYIKKLDRHTGEFAILAKYLFDIPMHYLEQIVVTLKNLLQIVINCNKIDEVDKYGVGRKALHDFIVYLIQSTTNIKERLDSKSKMNLIASISDEIINFAINFTEEPCRIFNANFSTTVFDRNKLIFDSQIISPLQRQRIQPILKSSFKKKHQNILWAFSYKNIQANDQNKPAVPDEKIFSPKPLSEWKVILPILANYLSTKQISYCIMQIFPKHTVDFKEYQAFYLSFLSSLSQTQRKNLLKETLGQVYSSIDIIPDTISFYHFNQIFQKTCINMEYYQIENLLINYHVLLYYVYYFSNSLDESSTIFSAIIHCHQNKISLNNKTVNSDNAGSNSLDDFEQLEIPEKLFIDTEAPAILTNTDNYQNTINTEQKSHLISALLPLVEKNNYLLTRIVAYTFLVKFSAALSDNQINQLIHAILEDKAFPTKFALIVLPKFIHTYFSSSQQLIFAERLYRFTIKSYQDLALYSDALYSVETMKSLRDDIDLNLLKLKVDQFIMKKVVQASIPKDVNLRYISTSLLATINNKKSYYSEASAILHSLLKASHKRNVEERELVDDNPSKKLKPF